MKRWLKLAVIFIVAVIAVLVVAGFIARSILNRSGKDRVVALLSAKLGVPVSVASVDLDLSQWFLLRPSIALNQVLISNPPGFAAKNLLDAKKISAKVALGPLLHRQIEVESIRVEQPHIVFETAANGQSNIESLIRKATASSAPNTAPNASNPAANDVNGSKPASLAIEALTVTSGTLDVTGAEPLTIHDLDLKLSGFSSDRSCRLEASAKPLGKESTFKIDGHAGPFSANSLPIDGKLSMTIAPAEIPAAMRREQFGNVLLSPGAKARTTVDADVKGDAYGVVSGPATVVVTNLLVGSHPDRLLPVSGKAPANVTATNLFSNAQIQVEIPNAKFQLGKGVWDGSATFGKQSGVMKIASRGAIRNLDVNQLLSVFTTERGKLYGQLAIPSYSLEMSGRNAEALKASSRGAGKLAVTQGRLEMLDLPATLQRAVGQQASAATKGVTSFESLTADLTIASEKINVDNLHLDANTLKVAGSGVIGFDQAINFKLQAHVDGGLGRLINTGPLHLPTPSADLPLTVTGTVESPQVHPQVAKIATGAAEGIFKSLRKFAIPK